VQLIRIRLSAKTKPLSDFFGKNTVGMKAPFVGLIDLSTSVECSDVNNNAYLASPILPLCRPAIALGIQMDASCKHYCVSCLAYIAPYLA